MYVLDLADRLISKAGPFAAAGIMVGSIYWTAVTYGAVTVMQVQAMNRPEKLRFIIRLFYLVSAVIFHSTKLQIGCMWLEVVVVKFLWPFLSLLFFVSKSQFSDRPSALQVVGHKEGLDVMERADPLFLLIGLPTIPVMLILGKMIRWEDYVLRLWRKYSNKLQILNSIFPGQDTQLCHV